MKERCVLVNNQFKVTSQWTGEQYEYFVNGKRVFHGPLDTELTDFCSILSWVAGLSPNLQIPRNVV